MKLRAGCAVRGRPSGIRPDHVAAERDQEADMGTFGTGPFGSDGALELLDELTGQPVGQRCEALERIFSWLRDRPDLLGRQIFADEIVAAAAVVAAARLPGGPGSAASRGRTRRRPTT
jgi:hypothetical protein